MAYLPQEEENKQQAQQGQEPLSKTNETVVGGQSGTVGGAAGGSGQAPAKAGQPSKSGSFTNLQSYVSANKGNDANMGQAIQTNTDQKIGGQNQAADGFKNTATSAVDAGTAKLDNNLLTQVVQDPTKVDKQAFTNSYNASYQGPNDAVGIEGYNDVNSGYDKLNATANQLGEFGGRQSILNDTYGQNNKYTQGEQRLDSFVLGAGEQGQQALGNIKNNIGAANTNWQNTLGSIGQAIQGGIDTSKATQDTTRGVFDGAVRQNEANFDILKNQAASITNQNANTVNQLKGVLSTALPGSVSYNNALSQIGITPEQATQLKAQGVKIADLVQGNAAVSLGDMANPANVKNYTALLNLIGATPEKYNFAGSNANKSAFTVDQAAIDGAISAYLAKQNQPTPADESLRPAYASSKPIAAPGSLAIPDVSNINIDPNNAQALGPVKTTDKYTGSNGSLALPNLNDE